MVSAAAKVSKIKVRSERGFFHLRGYRAPFRRQAAARAARHGRTGARKCPTDFWLYSCRGEIKLHRFASFFSPIMLLTFLHFMNDV